MSIEEYLHTVEQMAKCQEETGGDISKIIVGIKRKDIKELREKHPMCFEADKFVFHCKAVRYLLDINLYDTKPIPLLSPLYIKTKTGELYKANKMRSRPFKGYSTKITGHGDFEFFIPEERVAEKFWDFSSAQKSLLIDSIEKITRFYEMRSTMVVKHFELKGIKLPASMFDAIKESSKPIYTSPLKVGDDDCVHAILMGVPIERDENINKPQYIIEGDLHFL